MKLGRRIVLVVYIAWCVLISAYALSSYVGILERYLVVTYSWSIEAILVIGQVPFQWFFMPRTTWMKRQRYALIALTVSMIGSILLLPALFYHNSYSLSERVAVLYFFAVVGTIFLLHHILIRREHLPSILVGSWLLYRVLILIYLVCPFPFSS